MMNHHHHPLDWASYLHRHLVLEPVPTVLTLLVVAVHYHAVCSFSSSPSHTPTTVVNETSATGYLFASVGLILRSCQCGLSSCTAIRTPFSSSLQAPNPPQPPPPSPPPDAVVDVIKTAALTDPFTLAYNAWTYIAAAEDPPVVPLAKEQQQQREEEKETCTDEKKNTTASENCSTSGLSSWTHICVVHGIGLAGVLCSLGPSLCVATSKLVCNKAIPGMHPASAWPLVNGSALLLCQSWVFCCLLHSVWGLHELAECTAMHSVSAILYAYAAVATQCPLPPVYSQQAASKGMACALGVLLLFVSQMSSCQSAAVGQDFYMNHLWAVLVTVCLVLRHTLFRAVVWAMCIFQREGIFAARATYLDAMMGGNGGTVAAAAMMMMARERKDEDTDGDLLLDH